MLDTTPVLGTGMSLIGVTEADVSDTGNFGHTLID